MSEKGMEYRPPKPKSNEELKEKIKELEERLEKLEAENRELRERLKSDELLEVQKAKKEIDELVEKARKLVNFGEEYYPPYMPENVTADLLDAFVDYMCPASGTDSEHFVRQYGCHASTRIEGDKIIYGVQCNHPKTRGFYPQGEIPIPKYLRKYL